MENNEYDNETFCGASLVLDEEKGKWIEKIGNTPEISVKNLEQYLNYEIPCFESNPEKGNSITISDSLSNAIRANRNRRPTKTAQRVVNEERKQQPQNPIQSGSSRINMDK